MCKEHVQGTRAMHGGTCYPLPGGRRTLLRGRMWAGDGRVGFAAPRSPGAFGVCMGGEETRQQHTELRAKRIASEPSSLNGSSVGWHDTASAAPAETHPLEIG